MFLLSFAFAGGCFARTEATPSVKVSVVVSHGSARTHAPNNGYPNGRRQIPTAFGDDSDGLFRQMKSEVGEALSQGLGIRKPCSIKSRRFGHPNCLWLLPGPPLPPTPPTPPPTSRPPAPQMPRTPVKEPRKRICRCSSTWLEHGVPQRHKATPYSIR
jgi:hypothetical protein